MGHHLLQFCSNKSPSVSAIFGAATQKALNTSFTDAGIAIELFSELQKAKCRRSRFS
jgi:SH3-like domain-containing protein